MVVTQYGLSSDLLGTAFVQETSYSVSSRLFSATKQLRDVSIITIQEESLSPLSGTEKAGALEAQLKNQYADTFEGEAFDVHLISWSVVPVFNPAVAHEVYLSGYGKNAVGQELNYGMTFKVKADSWEDILDYAYDHGYEQLVNALSMGGQSEIFYEFYALSIIN